MRAHSTLTPFLLMSVLFSSTASLVAPTSVSAKSSNDKTCQTKTLQTHLIPGDPTTYNLIGKLCWSGNSPSKNVQLLVHGATYAGSYWDFPGVDSDHSYVDAAIKEGYTTFSYDRLGSGSSDKPPAFLVNVDNSAYVNHQVVEALRDGTFGKSFEKVVLVGHSLGSLISVAAATTYKDVDALVLTGFANQATAAANSSTQASVYPAAYDAKFAAAGLDANYFTTIPNTRAGLFFYTPKTTSDVLAADETNKDLMSLGLILDIPRHFSTDSLAIDVPVFVIMGDKDTVYCGEAVDCSKKKSLQKYEEGFFKNVKTELVKDVGHSMNLHKKSDKVFKSINKWIDKTL